MPTRVQIAFDLAANGVGNFFTLDDTTKGVLDNTTFVLGGDALVDVTSRVRSVQVKRGRSRQLDRFTAGNANVTLDNRDRSFDPLYAATVGTRTNLVTNPSFEVDTTGWASAQTIARSTAVSLFGSASLQSTMLNSADTNIAYFSGGVTVPTGTVTISVYFYVPAGSPLAGKSVSLSVEGGTATTGTPQSATAATLVAGSWARASLTRTVTVAGTIIFVCRLSVLPSTAVGALIYADAALMETGSALNPYFDGTSEDGSIRMLTQAWNGTANASTSTITYYVPGTGSPYYGSIIPGKQLVIDRDGAPIYTGNVADWNFGYDMGGDSVAEPSAVDGFAIIAQQTRTPGTATAEKTGTRIGKVLTEAGWPLTQRRLSVGQATLDADYVGDNVNSLGYIQTVGDISEPGAVFIGKDGAFVFRDRADLQGFSSGVTFGPAGIPMQAVEVVYGVEELWNAVRVTYSAGTVAVAGTATADDLTSQGKYGIIDQTYNTLLANAADAQALANWQLSQYAEPTYRFNTVTVNLLRLSTAQVGQVLALELGDSVNVTWTPNNVGSPISQYVTIDAIEHAISPADHQITFTLSQTIAAFILDDATFGVLDSNALGF